ncbi:uncharacterized protein LOC127878848 [Dreissena polymorpha]|uniref:uncharacterized protein LOC127878848 n=1 Tax=Dreissena polymorpha TaxID=45954 RepID=UPI002264F43D|nr:uncharacterized protein LOC127878848 [Dreissena polymorpha]
MSKQEWLVLLTVGFLLKVSTATVQILIPNSHITVTSNGTSWKDSKRSKNWTADKVKDGIVNNQGSADDCGCCAALLRPAWVQLTLNKTCIVEKIVVLGRADEESTQLFNLTLSLGRHKKSLQDEALILQNRSYAMKVLAPPRELDAVRVSGGTGQNIDTYMTICEIMLYRQAAV